MRTRLGKMIFRFLGKAVVGFIGLSVLTVALYRFVPVYVTPLMMVRCLEQLLEGKKLQLKHTWVAIEAISPNLILAVVCSEDQNFKNHFGFDLPAIERSFEAFRQGTKKLRGASTISQQTAKNVFLLPYRSWVRKGFEVYFTLLIEGLWNKERILEVYLNSIEMGDGVYGAEAASRHYFKTNAHTVARTQAAAIAAILPNPLKYNANPPDAYIKRRISWIMGQMDRIGTIRFL